jgi:hypothetical protein
MHESADSSLRTMAASLMNRKVGVSFQKLSKAGVRCGLIVDDTERSRLLANVSVNYRRFDCALKLKTLTLCVGRRAAQRSNTRACAEKACPSCLLSKIGVSSDTRGGTRMLPSSGDNASAAGYSSDPVSETCSRVGSRGSCNRCRSEKRRAPGRCDTQSVR